MDKSDNQGELEVIDDISELVESENAIGREKRRARRILTEEDQEDSFVESVSERTSDYESMSEGYGTSIEDTKVQTDSTYEEGSVSGFTLVKDTDEKEPVSVKRKKIDVVAMMSLSETRAQVIRDLGSDSEEEVVDEDAAAAQIEQFRKDVEEMRILSAQVEEQARERVLQVRKQEKAKRNKENAQVLLALREEKRALQRHIESMTSECSEIVKPVSGRAKMNVKSVDVRDLEVERRFTQVPMRSSPFKVEQSQIGRSGSSPYSSVQRQVMSEERFQTRSRQEMKQEEDSECVNYGSVNVSLVDQLLSGALPEECERERSESGESTITVGPKAKKPWDHLMDITEQDIIVNIMQMLKKHAMTLDEKNGMTQIKTAVDNFKTTYAVKLATVKMTQNSGELDMAAGKRLSNLCDWIVQYGEFGEGVLGDVIMSGVHVMKIIDYNGRIVSTMNTTKAAEIAVRDGAKLMVAPMKPEDATEYKMIIFTRNIELEYEEKWRANIDNCSDPDREDELEEQLNNWKSESLAEGRMYLRDEYMEKMRVWMDEKQKYDYIIVGVEHRAKLAGLNVTKLESGIRTQAFVTSILTNIGGLIDLFVAELSTQTTKNNTLHHHMVQSISLKVNKTKVKDVLSLVKANQNIAAAFQVVYELFSQGNVMTMWRELRDLMKYENNNFQLLCTHMQDIAVDWNRRGMDTQVTAEMFYTAKLLSSIQDRNIGEKMSTKLDELVSKEVTDNLWTDLSAYAYVLATNKSNYDEMKGGSKNKNVPTDKKPGDQKYGPGEERGFSAEEEKRWEEANVAMLKYKGYGSYGGRGGGDGGRGRGGGGGAGRGTGERGAGGSKYVLFLNKVNVEEAQKRKLYRYSPTLECTSSVLPIPGETPASAKVLVKWKNTFFSYTATKEPCLNCKHAPSCYNPDNGKPCPNCELFGHSISLCVNK